MKAKKMSGLQWEEAVSELRTCKIVEGSDLLPTFDAEKQEDSKPLPFIV